MLTQNVMEFTIETYEEVKVIPGQWALFQFEDEQWPFQRSYSIVYHDTDNEKTILIFAIILSEHGRGSTIIRKTTIGQEILLKGIFGNFTTQNTNLPKVFIGIWIGIIPLINMANHCPTNKTLFFSVSHKKDLFYEDRIKKIPGLGYEFFITQESVPGYSTWKIDFVQWNFDPHTEFYLSWQTEILDTIVNKLMFLGYKRIYTENF